MSTSDGDPKLDDEGTDKSAGTAPNVGRSAQEPAEGSDDAPGELDGSPRG